MSLEDHLKFSSLFAPLVGESPLEVATKPTRAGLNWLAVPSGCAGLAYRVRGTSLDALSVRDDSSDFSTLSSVFLGEALAVNVAASPDGRLVAVCLADGSLQCYDATATALQLRWKVGGAHSHVVTNINESVSASRANGAGAAGPAHSLKFSPTGYALALVDEGQLGLAIYRADSLTVPVECVQTQLSQLSVTSAAWSPVVSHETSESTLAIGTSNDGIHIYRFQLETSLLTYTTKFAFPGEDPNGWSCTHLEWLRVGTELAAGFCRVIPSDDDDEEVEADDAATHEASLFMLSLNANGTEVIQSVDEGDVVSFFSVPRHGRHVFFTSAIPTSRDLSLLVVAANVSSDVAVLSKANGGSWEIIDLPESDRITTPTNEDDEFMFPTGLAVMRVAHDVAGSMAVVVLAVTDGSLLTFRCDHSADEAFFNAPIVGLTMSLPEIPLPRITSVDSLDPPPKTTAGNVTSLPFGSGTVLAFAMEKPFSFSNLAGSLSSGEETPTPKQETSGVSELTVSSSQLLFGSTSAPLSATPTFDFKIGSSAPVTTPADKGVTAAAFGSGTSPPSFSWGAPSSSSLPPQGTSSSLSTFNQPTSSPFGVFGGKSADTRFGVMAKPLFGPSSSMQADEQNPQQQPTETQPRKLEATSSNESPAVLPVGPSSTVQVDEQSPQQQPTETQPLKLEATNSSNESPAVVPVGPSSTVQADEQSPQQQPTETQPPKLEPTNSSNGSPAVVPVAPSSTVQADEQNPQQQPTQTQQPKLEATNSSNETPSVVPVKDNMQKDSTDSQLAKTAARAFDSFDKEKSGYLPVSMVEALVDELGEGFHGDELDAQIALIDPKKTGKVGRSEFIAWYEMLAGSCQEHTKDDEASMDSEEEAEREEERTKALKCFLALSFEKDGKQYLSADAFPKLLESMGTTYCEEEHTRTVRKLQNSETLISLDSFVSWYLKWIFDGASDDSDDDDDDEIGAQSAVAGDAAPPKALFGWGETFKVDGDSWKCNVCSVRNKANAAKCAACETPRPGAEDNDTNKATKTSADGLKTATTTSVQSSSSNIGSSGFSFAFASTGSGGLATGRSTASSNTASVAATPFSGANDRTSTDVAGFSLGAMSAARVGMVSVSSDVASISNTSTVTISGADSFTAANVAPIRSATPSISSTGFSFSPLSTGPSNPLVGSNEKGSGSPPMSSVAPKPFAGLSTISPKPDSDGSKTSGTDGSAGFPPMSGTAPKPVFGSGAKESGTEGSGSFPPMSFVAPKPFSGLKEMPATVATSQAPSKAPQEDSGNLKAAVGSGFPPMSSVAPKPFAGLLTISPKPDSDGSKTSGTGGSAGFPPMSGTAPKPVFGSGAKESGTEASGSFPHMSFVAPKPFSGLKEMPATVATSQARSKTTQEDSGNLKAAVGSGFPPMSSVAPKPFAGLSTIPPTTASDGAKTSGTGGSAGFPPMSSTAPKPVFGSKSGTERTGSLPPMSQVAPKPFSGLKEMPANVATSQPPSKATQVKGDGPKAVASATFPPMSNVAPKPFAGLSNVPTKPASDGSETSGKAGKAGFPPMSSSAPKPVFALNESVRAASPARSKTTPEDIAGSAAFSLKGNSGILERSSAPSKSLVPEKGLGSAPDMTQGVSTKTQNVLKERNRSECSVLLGNLTKQLNVTLERLAMERPPLGHDKLREDIKSVVEDTRGLLIACADMVAQVGDWKDRLVVAFSLKTEASRKVFECQDLLSDSDLGISKEKSLVLREQQLDVESEKRRRLLTAQAMYVNRLLGFLKARASLLQSLNEPDGKMQLLYTVLDLYKSIKQFDEEQTQRVTMRLQQISPQRRLGRRQKRDKSPTKQRPGGLSSSDNVAQRRQHLLHKWKGIEAAFEQVGVPEIHHLNLDMSSTSMNPTSSTRPRRSSSRSFKPDLSKESLIFSPPVSRSARLGWEVSNKDQAILKQLSFDPPSVLKETTLDIQSRDALDGYGTTPEKVKEAIRVQKRATTSQNTPDRHRSTTNVNSSVATRNVPTALPPVRSKASAPSKPEPGPRAAVEINIAVLPSPPSDDQQQAATKKSQVVESSAFGNLASLTDSLFSSEGASVHVPKVDQGNSLSKPYLDYRKLLTEFYLKFNPSKIDEVTKTLEKFKGREAELFAKLASKYKQPNPLDSSSSNVAAEPFQSSSVPQQPTPFSNTNLSIGMSPLGGNSSSLSSRSPFGGSVSSSGQTSTFGSPGFGSPFTPNNVSTQSQHPFGGTSRQPSSAPPPQPSASPAGRNARQMLLAFYQQYNPSKMAEVDRLLAKYQGNEESMFRNLAKKYNLDPSVFGIPVASSTPGFGTSPQQGGMSPGGFGQPSVLGSGPSFGGPIIGPGGQSAGNAFGQTSALGGGVGVSSPGMSTAFGSNVGGFGSANDGAPSFGALAHNAAGSGFGNFSAAPAPFGLVTPFGGPRR